MIKKVIILLFTIVLVCIVSSSCGSELSSEKGDSTEQASSSLEAATNGVQDFAAEAEVSDEEILFESDETVNQFLNAYNEVAEYKIEPENIKKGNIRTKAILSLNDLYIEIVNASDEFLSVSITNSHETDTFFQVFRDFILANNQAINADTITTAWNDIQNDYYEIDYGNGSSFESYEVEGIQMAYFNSANRVDLLFTLSGS